MIRLLLALSFIINTAVLDINAPQELFQSLEKLPKTGIPPPKRQGAVLEMPLDDSGQYFYCLSGTNEENGYIASVFRYSFGSSSPSWEKVQNCGLEGNPARGWYAHFSTKTRLFCWGGESPEGQHNDMYIFDYLRSTWTRKESDKAPSSREMMQHAFNANAERFYIFGGRGSIDNYGDLWEYDAQNGEWKQLYDPEQAANLNAPTARYGGAAHFWNGNLYILGGYPSTEEETSKLVIYEFNIGDKSWKKHVYDDITSCRSEVGYSSLESELFVYGGASFHNGVRQNVNELLRIKFEASKPVVKKYQFPSGGNVDYSRRSPGFIAVKQSGNTEKPIACYVFGGIGKSEVQGDLLRIQLTASTESNENLLIEQVTKVVPDTPPPRTHHGSINVLGKMWIYGGLGEGEETSPRSSIPLNDLYSFDYSTSEWEKHEGLGSPPARSDFSIIEQASRLFLFGGLGTDSPIDDLTSRNDMWQYSIVLNEWSRVYPTTSLLPSPRSGTCGIVIGKWIYYFGGRLEDGSVTNEVWRFSLVTNEWRKMNVYYSPKIEVGGSKFEDLVFDPNAPGTVPVNENSRVQLQKREKMAAVRKDVWMDGVEYQVVVIAGGVTRTRDPSSKIDVVLIPPSFDAEEGKEPENTDPSMFKVYITDPIVLNDENLPEHPFRYGSLTVVGDQGFISLGGVDEDMATNNFHWVDVLDLKNVKHTWHNGSTGSTKLPYLCGGSVQYFGRKLYVFGGNLMINTYPSDKQYQNDLYEITLKKEHFVCSPGTKERSNGDIECDSCPVGSFSWRFGLTWDCTYCYAGSANKYVGGSSGYHCIACAAGTYNDKSGQKYCTKCSDGSYCPIGSATENTTRPTKTKENDIQPQLFKSRDIDAMYILIGCYVGFLVVGIAVSICCVCCPVRVYMFKFDLYSSEHDEDFDPETHAAPKILRKNRVGGFVSIIFIFFAVGAAASVVGEFAINNRTEVKSVIAAAMETEVNVEQLSMKQFETSVTMLDYCGGCVTGLNDTTVETDWMECNSQLLIKLTNMYQLDYSKDKKNPTASPLVPMCKQTPSKSKMINPVANCMVRVKTDKPTVLYFPSDGSSPVLSISTNYEKGHAYSFLADAVLDTGIVHDYGKASDNPISSRQLLAVSGNGKPFKGVNMTEFNMKVIPSVFVNEKQEKTTGYQIISSSTTLGTTASEDELNTAFGMKVKLTFDQDTNVVLTTFSMRQSVAAFFANIMSTAMGYMGIFGVLVSFLDMVTSLDLPCSMKMRLIMYGNTEEAEKKKRKKKIDEDLTKGVYHNTDEDERESVPHQLYKPVDFSVKNEPDEE
ncbi:putative member of the kelch motif protein family [Monocercomonoides exilis]|uniref:putative member of the kelch motif protein family n=1 Tax=Monocercomonoides exilis TaxID=2049356 RepID=UPI0035594CB2|nr:putative member of the kelch motif protein family [Monocercomonoides exilis]|eukprot:MONOS_9577.1-p1 / transcript=MONOS_9577.1 / gene=MONOS_9577 / organism=Monocercomonoides_exilis_PA203 / gene_product=member of the kelch motif protein family / transcript_product=member of the kelch motif protein family / location=Mono_scaffold00400:28859-32936(-) / protein_length=1309 / sequence_SO=supercontig / SO=protein_coding / is_pseudo=false